MTMQEWFALPKDHVPTWQEVWDAARLFGWNAALEKAAKVAETTICDTHIPTGVDIYGSRAAKNIRALACSPVASDLMKEE